MLFGRFGVESPSLRPSTEDAFSNSHICSKNFETCVKLSSTVEVMAITLFSVCFLIFVFAEKAFFF